MPNRRDPETGLCRRGTSNGNDRGSADQRRRRKIWLLETYRADVDWSSLLGGGGISFGLGEPACRCFRCGRLLTLATMTVDRIVPGYKKTAKYPNGGTYVRENIRPSCGECASDQGGQIIASRHTKVKT